VRVKYPGNEELMSEEQKAQENGQPAESQIAPVMPAATAPALEEPPATYEPADEPIRS